MENNVQIINYSGKFSSKSFKVNKLNSPESFNDYEINIIDLSCKEIWRNNGESYTKINCMQDIKNIATMIKVSKKKVLIVLPQNLMMKYYLNSAYDYSYEIELKNNINLLNNIIETMSDIELNCTLLIYNKTNSDVNGSKIKSDFVFHNINDTIAVTYNTNKTSITSIKFANKYFTTLELINEEDYLNYFKTLKWNTEKENIPKWLHNEYFFNDHELTLHKNDLMQQLNSIKNQIDTVNKELDKNMFYKTGLYKSGDELVEVVNEILRQMVDYEPEKFKDLKEEDFLFENNEHFFIGEIKGINSNINRSNVTQTATHKNLYMEIEGNENKQVFAIAIINRQRTKPLKERDGVSKDVIELAKINKVLLIKMETLLQLFDRFKQNKISKDDILNLFMTETGLLELKNKD